MSFPINGAMARYGLDEQQPIFFGIINYHIRHFAVGINDNTKTF